MGCLECGEVIAPKDGETILQCCPRCFDAIMQPFSVKNSAVAKEVRRLAQVGIAEIFQNEYVRYAPKG